VLEIPPFTLQRLIQTLVERWRIAASIVVACLLLGVVYLHITPQRYSVQMEVVAASGDQTSNQAPVGAGAALLTQLRTGGDTSQNNFELYLAGLKSIEAARVLAQNPAIMHRMFASEWSAKDNQWSPPFSLLDGISRFVKSIYGIYVPQWQPPDAMRVNEFLQGNIDISRSVVSPAVTISMLTTDRQFGVDLINALHGAVDDILRRRILARETGYVDYLNGLIDKATMVEYRSALAETIMQQQKVRMVAASGSPFAADVFARTTPSRLPTSPNGFSTLVISILIGIALAIAEAILSDRFDIYRRLSIGPPARSTKGRV